MGSRVNHNYDNRGYDYNMDHQYTGDYDNRGYDYNKDHRGDRGDMFPMNNGIKHNPIFHHQEMRGSNKHSRPSKKESKWSDYDGKHSLDNLYFPRGGTSRYPYDYDYSPNNMYDKQPRNRKAGKPKEEETEDSKGVKDELSHFADNSSVAGLSFINNSKTWYSRLIWTLCFLGALGMLSWQMVTIFIHFYDRPVNTNLKLESKKGGLNFPTVTICNMNPIRNGYIYLDPTLDEYYQEIYELINSVGQEDGTNEGHYLDDLDTDYGSDYEYDDVYGETDPATEMRNYFKYLMGQIPRNTSAVMSNQKDIAIRTCTFNEKKCYSSNFTSFWNKDYGNCYSWNSHFVNEKSLKSKFTGSTYGLTLELYKDDSNYLSGITTGSGFRVAINPFGYLAFPLRSGISISPGTDTFIGLNYETVDRPGSPYGACDKGEDFNEWYNANYTKQACFNTCPERKVGELCNCYELQYYEWYTIYDRENLKQCTTETELDCAYEVARNVTQGIIECDGCIPPCDESHYKIEVTQNRWPDYGSWNIITGQFCNDYPDEIGCWVFLDYQNASSMEQDAILRTEFARLNIFFKDLVYHKIEEKPAYPIANFAADIGGTLGLWLGLTVFSGFELINLIVRLFKSCRK